MVSMGSKSFEGGGEGGVWKGGVKNDSHVVRVDRQELIRALDDRMPPLFAISE